MGSPPPTRVYLVGQLTRAKGATYSFHFGWVLAPRNACNSKIPSSRMFRNKTWHNFGTKIDLKLIDNDQVAGFYLPGYPCEDIMD